MADYYGTGIAESDSAFDKAFRAAAGFANGRLRVSGSRITRLLTTSDVARMISLRSTDRLWALYAWGNGAAAAGACDVGLHYGGTSHNGAVLDADFFASAITAPSSAAFAEIFAERLAANSGGRGLPLWEAAGLSADPGGKFDITITPTTSFTTTAPLVTLFAFFSAGD